MKIGIFHVNCNPLRVWGPFIIQSLSIILQHLSGIFREWMYCRQTRDIWLVLFKLQTTMSTQVYCNVHVTALDTVAPSCGQQESGSSCMTMCGITICQRISVSTSNHSIATCATLSRFVTLRFFLIPMTKRALKGHHYIDETAVTKQLCSIPASALQVCFKDLKKCWKQCIDAEGSYFKEHP